MNPPGHVHNYSVVGGPNRMGRYQFQCATCPNVVWTAREAGPARNVHPWGLTDMECDVLAHFIDGHRRYWIAHHMGIARRSVDGHLYRIRKKIGGETMAEAVSAWKLETGVEG